MGPPPSSRRSTDAPWLWRRSGSGSSRRRWRRCRPASACTGWRKSSGPCQQAGGWAAGGGGPWAVGWAPAFLRTVLGTPHAPCLHDWGSFLCGPKREEVPYRTSTEQQGAACASGLPILLLLLMLLLAPAQARTRGRPGLQLRRRRPAGQPRPAPPRSSRGARHQPAQPGAGGEQRPAAGLPGAAGACVCVWVGGGVRGGLGGGLLAPGSLGRKIQEQTMGGSTAQTGLSAGCKGRGYVLHGTRVEFNYNVL